MTPKSAVTMYNQADKPDGLSRLLTGSLQCLVTAISQVLVSWDRFENWIFAHCQQILMRMKPLYIHVSTKKHHLAEPPSRTEHKIIRPTDIRRIIGAKIITSENMDIFFSLSVLFILL